MHSRQKKKKACNSYPNSTYTKCCTAFLTLPVTIPGKLEKKILTPSLKLTAQLQATEEPFINTFHEHWFNDVASAYSLDPVIPLLISVIYLVPLKGSK